MTTTSDDSGWIARIQRSPFRRQVSFFVAFGIVLMAALSFIAVSWQSTKQIQVAMVAQGESLADAVAHQSQLALLTGSSDNAAEVMGTAMAFPDVVSIVLYRVDGSVLTSRGSGSVSASIADLPGNERPTVVSLVGEDGTAWRFVAPVMTSAQQESPFDVQTRDAELLGYVAIEKSKATLSRLNARIFATNFAVASFFAIAFLWLLRRLLRRLTQPLATLEAVMEEAQGGTTGLRATVTGPRDVVRMADTFNGMMQALEERESELREARDAALHFARLKADFVATMSHEIRTPLNGVVGALDMLKTAGLPTRQRDFVDLAWDSSQYLLDLVNNILDFSRMEAGKLELEQRVFELHRTVEDVLDLLAPEAYKKGLAFGYLAEADVPHKLIGDPRRLRQILINLVGNAIKFTSIGEVAVKLSLATDGERGKLLRIDVVDTGIGVDPGTQERIFDSFTQADTSTTRRFGGSGLGLAISKQLVELMHGRIGVSGKPGSGSDFWIEIPLQPATHVPVAVGVQGRGRRVLVVDPVASVCRFLEQAMHGWGYAVTCASRPEEAMQRLREAQGSGQGYALVIVDAAFIAELPAQMHADTDLTGVRIVAMNPLGGVVNSRHCDAVLPKPLRIDRLLGCLADLDFPVRAGEAATAEREGAPASANWRVLVVEDNHTNQAIVQAMLELVGCRVEVAENGLEALRACRGGNRWDLILMDCNMPVMDGYEATAAIRALEAETLRRTPIIAMTANTQPADVEKGMASGMDDHLPKPVTLGALTAKLQRWVSENVGLADIEATPVPLEAGDIHAVDPVAFARLREVLGAALGEAVQPYLEDMPRHLDLIETAIAEGHAGNLQRSAHTIKGASSNLGANRLSLMARDVEERAQHGDLALADPLGKMRAEYALVREALIAELSTSPERAEGEAESKAHILVVDDDRSTRVALRHALAKSGFAVSEASNGVEALTLLQSLVPDVILMDAMMPEMDGFTACARIQEMPLLRDVPVLIVTALEDGQSIERAFACGASDYLTKPLHLSVVNQRVRRVVDARRAERHVRLLAYNDTLTGLPNRVMFTDRLGEAIERAALGGHKLGVLFLDLDRFKFVNDTLGHEVGDTLLVAVAERIRQCVRGGDCVARLGGDEFTVLIDEIASAGALASAARKIGQALSTAFVIGEHEVPGVASIGIAVYPEDGEDVSTLLRHADTAMYRAKRGNSGFAFYESGMEDIVSARLRMESEMRRALERGEFVVYYQPCADAASRQIVSVEALVRWQHPERGLVPPGEFIPLAEETGMILELGQWVLHSACRQVEAWRTQGIGNLRVAVNISGFQLRQADFVASVQDVLEATGLPAELLTLEITESVLMDQAGDPVELLRQLSDLGLQLAIDDFGTGYSSLAYLKRFPVDLLKIDRSFVMDADRNPDDEAIVAGIIALARSLRLKVVAEGVETESQREVLLRHGCDIIQGYLLAKPLAPPLLEDYLLLPARAG